MQKTHRRGRENPWTDELCHEYTGFINCNSLYIIIGFHVTSSRERESSLQAVATLLYKLGSTICRTCDIVGVKTEFKSWAFKVPVHQHMGTMKFS